MKVVFYSNFLNHHQLPFCEKMVELTGGQFFFIANAPIPTDRLDFGYHDMNKAFPFVIPTYDCKENFNKAKRLILDSDIAIIGGLPTLTISKRVRQNKLTFFVNERIYKEGINSIAGIRSLVSAWLHTRGYQNKQTYMLCASAYTAADYSVVRAYKGKTYKWGYFPNVKHQNIDEIFKKKRSKNRISLLWAGRLIPWKHPEIAIKLAKRLSQENYEFDLDIIGNGEQGAILGKKIQEMKLNDCVHLRGAMSPECVREYMEKADIFLFTSDFNEGWGAVLNESMNSLCTVVASHAIGSVPFLVKDEVNGLIYENGNFEHLHHKVKRAIDNVDLRERLGQSAYNTMIMLWNPEIAAERFVCLAKEISNKTDSVCYQEGPCSKAEILANQWYKIEQ